MRLSSRTLERLCAGLGQVFPSAAVAFDDDFELAAEADSLHSTVIGGLTGHSSGSTGAVVNGTAEAKALLAEFGARMTTAQRSAVEQLLDALQGA